MKDDKRQIRKMQELGMGYTSGTETFRNQLDVYKEMADEIFRGAPMGRQNEHVPDKQDVYLYLYKVTLDLQGYDGGGAYWGIGEPIYHAHDKGAPGDRVSFYFRLDKGRDRMTTDRDHAKAEVLRLYPQARFRR